MFRATKKKPKRVIISRGDDDDDDGDEAPAVIIQQPKKKKKKKRTLSTIRSFAAGEEEDNDHESNAVVAPKSKKKRKGLGFGGAPVVKSGSKPTLSETPRKEEESAMPATESTNMYDMSALNALKSQQRYRQNAAKLPPLQKEAVITSQKTDEKHKEEAYISLSGEPASILTGDDADAYLGGNPEEDVYDSKPSRGNSNTVMEDVEASDTDDWEAQVTKRAGLGVSNKKKSNTKYNNKSLTELRESLSDTLVQLQSRNEDLQNAHARRQTEVNQIEAEVQKHQSELHQSGEALEFYQELRLQLAEWVGALRDLKKRLAPLHEALRQVFTDSDELAKWTDWENDIVLVLRRANRIVQVAGRQPTELPPDAVDVEVDEFGRDMKSQHVLAREKRFQQRRTVMNRSRNQEQGGSPPETIVPFASPVEREEMEQRCDALQQALGVAMDDMDETYVSLSNLAALFQEWHRKQPQDYANCHAGMSLADLASVLIHVNVFSTHYPLNWTASDEFPQMNELRQMAFDEALEETPLYRTVDKVLIPVFENVLEQYNVHSLHQTKSMATYFREMSKLLPPGNILIDKLTSHVVDRLRCTLNDMAIPIITKANDINNATGGDSDEVLTEAIEYATKTQVSRIQTILNNIFTYWVPLLGDRLADPILDFLSSQFLYLVSSLESPTKVFGAIWPAVEGTQWLDRPELMVAAAPLRAAAVAFAVETTK